MKKENKLVFIVQEKELIEWVNSKVRLLKPNNKLSICIDPKDLDKSIRREHYQQSPIFQ